MELRRRIAGLVHLRAKLRDPPASVSKELASLEALAAHHRYLRGLMAALAVIVFVVSLLELAEDSVNTLLDSVVLVLSLAGEVLIVKVYKIKAIQAGLTDPLYKHASVLHSPHLPMMLAEMVIWLLHSPPGIGYYFPDAYLLDFFIIFRAYCVLLYLNNATFVHRTFCRAMSALSEIPLSISFYVRTSFLFDRTRASVAALLAGWCALALLFSKGEGYSFFDSLYFCFVTGATIGYGDIAPRTVPGRLVAFFSWVFGLTVVGWVVGLTHESLSLTDAERHLYTLFRANDLCNRIPNEAAKVIQRTWRLRRGRKANFTLVRLNYLGYRLSSQLMQFREDRRALRNNEASFMATMSEFEGKGQTPPSSLPSGASSMAGSIRIMESSFDRRGSTSTLSPLSASQSPVNSTTGRNNNNNENNNSVPRHNNNVPASYVWPHSRDEDDVEVGGVSPPPVLGSTLCPEDTPDVLKPNTTTIRANVTAPVMKATSSASLSHPSSCAVPTHTTAEQRIAQLESTVDELILLAEALVRKRASREDSRRSEGREDNDEDADIAT